MKKILVVEDDQRIAELLKKGLEELGYNITVAYDGKMGKRLASQDKYDLIITDVILPHIDGFELCKIVRSINPSTPIIMLTALGTTDDKLEGFESGADDYLVKPFDLRELHARIKVLLKRKGLSNTFNTSKELEYKGLKLDSSNRTVSRDGVDIKLTRKEFNLLLFMMENPERILTRVEIAEKVWDTHFDTGTNFIDVYITYLRRKIDKTFTHKLIHTCQGIGFILKKEEEEE